MIRNLQYLFTRHYLLWLLGLFTIFIPALFIIALCESMEQGAVTIWVSLKDHWEDIGITKDTFKRDNYSKCKKRFDKVKSDV